MHLHILSFDNQPKYEGKASAFLKIRIQLNKFVIEIVTVALVVGSVGGEGRGGKGQREQVRLRMVEPFITIDAQLPRSTLRPVYYYNMQ